MTDEAAVARPAAGSHGPATTGNAAPSPADPALPPPDGAAAGDPPPAPPGGPAAGDPPATSPHGPPGPPAAESPLRHGLVRPRHGRYVAGVCAAIGRATNTDPILWRVLIAVLGFFGGIGILVYLAAWLIIPAEGDTASPVEAMLGRGRSSLSPVLVLLLGVLVAAMFAFIVTDASRAALLGLAILVGGALVLNRNGGTPENRDGTTPVNRDGTTPGDPIGANPSATTNPPATPVPPTPAYPPAPAGSPVTMPVAAGAPSAPPQPTMFGAAPRPPTGGYREPFAPRGPYATTSAYPPGYPPVGPPVTAAAPKPPRERSPLGAATFSLLFVALGLVAIVDLTDAAPVRLSTYFAAALVTIAAGLLLGAWFGRARWLIALGLVAALGLGVSSATESWTQVSPASDVSWQPANFAALGERYESTIGDAVLDLSRVDFTGQNAQVTVTARAGSIEVILPPKVDVSSRVELGAGDAVVFGQRWEGLGLPPREVPDNGVDGAGKLRLIVQLHVGDVEVHR